MAANGASAVPEEENQPESATMERDSDIEEMDNVKLEKAPKKSAMKSVSYAKHSASLSLRYMQENDPRNDSAGAKNRTSTSATEGLRARSYATYTFIARDHCKTSVGNIRRSPGTLTEWSVGR